MNNSHLSFEYLPKYKYFNALFPLNWVVLPGGPFTRYTREAEIGQGASGVVYRALDRVTGKVVAIKQLVDRDSLPSRELTIAYAITHPHVCRVHDYVQNVDGGHCLVMEFVDGGTLRDLLNRSGRLPLGQALSIARQMLDALAAIHSANIVHRDLKPENILLTAKGDVKVGDFSHARAAGTKAGLHSRRDLGTPGYIAPEQANNAECDPSADIYSFGVILYEMLCGERPQSTGAAFPSGFPNYVRRVIRRCLESDAARRFASVSEVRSALVSPLLSRRVSASQMAASVSLAAVVWLILIVTKPTIEIRPSGADDPPIEAERVRRTELLAASPQARALPTVAVFFDGPAGDAFGEAVTGQGRFQVVERRQLKRILSELEMSKDGAVDLETAQRAGRIAGAQYMLFGSVQTAFGKVAIHARLIRTETTEYVSAQSISGEAGDMISLAVQLAGRFHV